MRLQRCRRAPARRLPAPAWPETRAARSDARRHSQRLSSSRPLSAALGSPPLIAAMTTPRFEGESRPSRATLCSPTLRPSGPALQPLQGPRIFLDRGERLERRERRPPLLGDERNRTDERREQHPDDAASHVANRRAAVRLDPDPVEMDVRECALEPLVPFQSRSEHAADLVAAPRMKVDPAEPDDAARAPPKAVRLWEHRLGGGDLERVAAPEDTALPCHPHADGSRAVALEPEPLAVVGDPVAVGHEAVGDVTKLARRSRARPEH